MFLISPLEILRTTYAKNPRAIPFAIENVRGIITMITRAGKSSVVSDQFSFSMPLIIRIDTKINAPAVSYARTNAASGEQKMETKNDQKQ